MFVKKIILLIAPILILSKISFSSNINLQNTIDGKLFLDSLFSHQDDAALLADEIQNLQIDLSYYLKNPLTLNAYLSYFGSLEYRYSFHSVPERLSFYSLPIFWYTKAKMLEYLAVEDFLSAKISFAKRHIEEALFVYQLKRQDQQVAEMAMFLSKISFLSKEEKAAFFNNSISIRAYQHADNELMLVKSLFWQANLLYEDKQYKAAEELLLRRILMKVFHLGDSKLEMEAYYQLGKNYFKMSKKTEALWFFLQSRELALKLHNKESELKNLLMIAKLKVKGGNLSLALSDLKSAENIIVTYPEYVNYDLDLSRQFSELYRILGAKDQSQIYSLRFSQLRKEYMN